LPSEKDEQYYPKRASSPQHADNFHLLKGESNLRSINQRRIRTWGTPVEQTGSVDRGDYRDVAGAYQ
jgi:hypothetical protein